MMWFKKRKCLQSVVHILFEVLKSDRCWVCLQLVAIWSTCSGALWKGSHLKIDLEWIFDTAEHHGTSGMHWRHIVEMQQITKMGGYFWGCNFSRNWGYEGTTSGMQETTKEMHRTQNCNWSWFQGRYCHCVEKSRNHCVPVISCSWCYASLWLVQLLQALQSKTFPQSASEILGSPATAQRARRMEMRLTPAWLCGLWLLETPAQARLLM